MTGSRICRNLTLTSKDKLDEDALRAPTKSRGTFTFTSTVSQASTPISVPVPAPILLGIYTNVNLQKTTKMILELFVESQKQGQVNSTTQNRVFKV